MADVGLRYVPPIQEHRHVARRAVPRRAARGDELRYIGIQRLDRRRCAGCRERVVRGALDTAVRERDAAVRRRGGTATVSPIGRAPRLGPTAAIVRVHAELGL